MICIVDGRLAEEEQSRVCRSKKQTKDKEQKCDKEKKPERTDG